MGIFLDIALSALIGFSAIAGVFALSALGNGSESLVEHPDLLWVGIACATLPLAVAALYWFKQWSFLGMKPWILCLGCSVLSIWLHAMGATWKTAPLVLRGIEPFDYSVSAGKAYYKGELIESADGKSFRVLIPQQVAIDDTNVYRGREKIPGAHAPSFKILSAIYQIDRTQVYHRFALLEGADPLDFRILNPQVAMSGGKVFHDGKVVTATTSQGLTAVGKYYLQSGDELFNQEFKPIARAPETPAFGPLSVIPRQEGNDDIDVLSDGKNIFYVTLNKANNQLTLKHVPQALPASFRSLGSGYYRDAERFYHFGAEVRELERAANGELRVLNHSLAASATALYWRGEIVPQVVGIDVTKLTELLLRYRDELLDQHGKRVNLTRNTPKLDQLAAVPMHTQDWRTGMVFTDGAQIYYLSSDTATSQTILLAMEGARPQSFRHVTEGYFQDADSVYYLDGTMKVLEGADASTFEAHEVKHTAGGIVQDARDKSSGYLAGRRGGRR